MYIGQRNASRDKLLLSTAIGLEHLHLLPFNPTGYDRAARPPCMVRQGLPHVSVLDCMCVV
jgi:hypothetical protein